MVIRFACIMRMKQWSLVKIALEATILEYRGVRSFAISTNIALIENQKR